MTLEWLLNLFHSQTNYNCDNENGSCQFLLIVWLACTGYQVCDTKILYFPENVIPPKTNFWSLISLGYTNSSISTPNASFCTTRFGLVGNVVGRINEVNKRRARLALGWVTVFKTGKPSLYVTSHPGQLSLVIPPRVGKMSTGDDYGHRQRRNGEVCVTGGPVTRTADILTQSVIWRT